MIDGQAILLAAAGAAASWYFSRGTDIKAALRRVEGDNQKLLQATNILGRALEHAGIGKLTFDPAGNLTGIIVTGTFHVTGSSHVVARGVATYAPPPLYDRQHEQPEPGNVDRGSDSTGESATGL